MDSPSPSWLASAKPGKQAFLYSILALACCGCALLLLPFSGFHGRGEVSLQGTGGGREMLHPSIISRKVSEGIKQLDSQVHTLDTIRNKMWGSLHKAQKMSAYKDVDIDDEDFSQLHRVAQEALRLRDELQKAAASEKSILVRSEEILDGGCKDHHKESCGGESCCSFWARRGQCASNNQWMSVMCSRSCSTCSQDKADVKKVDMLLSHQHEADGMISDVKASAAPLAHVKAQQAGASDKHVDVSLSLEGVAMNGITRQQLDEILRKAVAKATKKPADALRVKLESFDFSPARHVVKRKEPIRRDRSREFVYGVAPEEPRLDSFLRKDGGFSPRRRLLAVGKDSRIGTLDLKFHLQLPSGEDQNSITRAIKSELHDEEEKPKDIAHGKEQLQQALHQETSITSSTGTTGAGGGSHSNFEDILSGKASHPEDRINSIPVHSQDASGPAEERQWVSPLVGKPRAYSNGYGLGLGINKKAAPARGQEGEAGWTFLEPFGDEEPKMMKRGSRPEDCGEACSEEAASQSREDARKGALRAQAEDQVKLKKEQVIEDSRTLKHLLTAIAEESLLLNLTQANASSTSLQDSSSASPSQVSMQDQTSAQIHSLKQKASELEEGARRKLAGLRGRVLSQRQENMRRLSRYYVNLAQRLAADGQNLQQRLLDERQTLSRFQHDGYGPMWMGRRREAAGFRRGGGTGTFFVRPLEPSLRLSPERTDAATESNIRKISEDLKVQTARMNRESEDFRQLIRRIRRETGGA
ncbi:hypothetical protein GUITHDRAFT_162138 [Guillardia theta CCMP2712]|uniref:ShKT domain-containing protein n=1 Tax=Guillardia theta (strain CCMP2712) TaxID=905079 RepID=L1JM82_GUITC|nr:hypothetical protein GUITHDRAFT_162138 [Guillardia theta CCMP2712]EKX49324.1 hypothetical protein GUITHDRAFT_162138 [Guillardia theta CCMP2712]|eukprot:XP_005836304.1 hypothetical protein GUITHDRAFT_162138 [Guillardia theta CCMP2712]